MLFDRVIAKSHEEITDEAILELEKEPSLKQDSEGSNHSNSPKKMDIAKQEGRLVELQKKSASNPSQNEQEEML